MFQFCTKPEKFDVLRMFRLLVSSRYRRVRKMQLHLVLLYPRPPPTGSWDSRGKVVDNYFLIVSAVPGKCGGITLGHLPC